MRKKEKDFEVISLLLIGGVVGGTLGLVCGIVILSNFYLEFKSDKLAAWFQVGTSGLAVLAAFIVANFQTRHDRKKEEEKNISKLDGVSTLVRQANVTTRTIRKNILEEQDLKRKVLLASGSVRVFESFDESLKSIPRHEHPYSYLGLHVSNSRHAVARITLTLKEMAEFDYSLPPNRLGFEQYEKKVNRLSRTLQQHALVIRKVVEVYDGANAPNVQEIWAEVSRSSSALNAK